MLFKQKHFNIKYQFLYQLLTAASCIQQQQLLYSMLHDTMSHHLPITIRIMHYTEITLPAWTTKSKSNFLPKMGARIFTA